MPDRQALLEIEITPEMIEAGVDDLLEFTIYLDDPSEVVRRVLRSALSAYGAHEARNNNWKLPLEMDRPPNGAISGQ